MSFLKKRDPLRCGLTAAGFQKRRITAPYCLFHLFSYHCKTKWVKEWSHVLIYIETGFYRTFHYFEDQGEGENQCPLSILCHPWRTLQGDMTTKQQQKQVTEYTWCLCLHPTNKIPIPQTTIWPHLVLRRCALQPPLVSALVFTLEDFFLMKTRNSGWASPFKTLRMRQTYLKTTGIQDFVLINNLTIMVMYRTIIII